jgi:hypothetical protein
VENITKHRPIDIITTEIQFYKAQAGTAILEIGRRLTEAKAQLAHGEWLPWLNERVEFTEKAAQRFMLLAKEYASNPTALSDLWQSKALALLALPPEEREAFTAETHLTDAGVKTVAEMSSRELEQAIKERDEAIKGKTDADKNAALYKKRMENANGAAEKAIEEARIASEKAETALKEAEA